MILSNIKQAQEFLPSLNLSEDNKHFNNFFRRAQEWLVEHVIGESIEEVLETDLEVGQNDSHKDLRVLCQRVIAEKALLDAIPEMDMQLTEAGFAVQSNDKMTPASAQRVDRLMAKMPERIANDMDALVRYLMKCSTEDAAYDYWRSTEQFELLTGAFMPLFEEFNKLAIPAAKTYEEFYAALFPMSKAMKKTAAYYVSGEEVDRLLELYRDGDVLQIHRMAIAELKGVAAAAFRKDEKTARDYAISAREVMLHEPDSFPAFKASSAFNSPTVNLDGGKMVNFL